MKKAILNVVLAAVAVAQLAVLGTVTVSVTDKQVTFRRLEKSTVTFGAASATADSVGKVSFDVSIDTNRRPPAGVQFDLAFDANKASGITAVAGPVATTAQKQVQCSVPTPGIFRCIVFGVNQSVMNDGVVATVSATISDNTNMVLQNVVASAVSSTALLTAISPANAVLTYPTFVSAFACQPPLYELPGLPVGTYNVEEGEAINCTVTLNRAASSPFVAPISPSTTGLTLPTSVTIPQGQPSVSFIVTGQ